MALDRKKIATAIRERRKELGYTRDRVLDIVSPEFLSRHTLERIENADGTVSAAKIRFVMEALQMRPSDHMDTDSIFDSSISSPELEKRLDAERVLFPAESLPLAYPIRNLADLIAFYPLLGLDQIANVTERIAGGTPGFESYIFSKLQELPDKIPASPPRDYAVFLRSENPTCCRRQGRGCKSKDSVPKHSKEMDLAFQDYYDAVQAFCHKLRRAEMYSRADVERKKKRTDLRKGDVVFGAVRLCGKLYWFNVRIPLLEYLSTGSRVICETGSGLTEGTLTELRIGSDLHALERGLGFIPEHDIQYIYSDVPMEQIYVSREHAAHPPAAVEIRLQKEEWYENGRFTTEVSIRSDGLLLDGYPVYLAAV